MILTSQQKLAVEAVERNVLVSAGAGAGKTHVLVERYIEVLRRDPDCQVANLIAVTYTRKAASEMRTRLKARFQRLLEEDNELYTDRWSRCLTEIDSARIGTIHGLCESILKTFPAETGVDPQFEVLSDLEQAELFKQSIDQALREVIATQTAEHDLLLRHELDDIRTWLSHMLANSSQFREALQSHGESRDEQFLSHANRILIETKLQESKELVNSTNWLTATRFLRSNPWADAGSALAIAHKDILALAQAVESSVDQCTKSPQADTLKDIHAHFSQIRTIKPGNAGGRSNDARAIRDAIKQLRELGKDYLVRLPEEINNGDTNSFRSLAQLIALFERAHETYSAHKRLTLKLDFNDLITGAHTVLSAPNSAARKYFNATIKAILVDEFQDTNAQQAAIIRALADDATQLFAIGDDKQSVYKFQGADVSTFNEWKHNLVEKVQTKLLGTTDGALLLGLSQSFRSHPSIVQFINFVFSKLMRSGSDSRSYRATFQPLHSVRAEGGDPHRVNVILFNGKTREEKRDRQNSKLCEGKAVAQWVTDMVQRESPIYERESMSERPIRFGDFAVLVQRNNDFNWIETALADEAIPYVVLGGKGFLDRQEVYDMENLLGFLANPLDSHSLLGALRSPIFAITDDLIHTVVSTKPRQQSLWQSLQDVAKLRKPGFESICKAVVLLSTFIYDTAQLSISALVRRIILKTHYDLVLLSLPNGRQRSRNLWKVAALAAEHDYMSCGEFAKSLKLMRQYNVKQADSPLDTGDSVKLMTIHSSKGLEFPAVALPVLGAKVLLQRSQLLYHRHFGVAFNDVREADEEKPSWYKLASFIHDDMEVEERKRLLYVAMTRARDYLGIFLEREATNYVSFRAWLKDVLQLNLAEEEAGIRSVNSDFGQLKYLLSDFNPARSSVDQNSGEQVQPGSDFSFSLGEEEDTTSSALRLDLIEPMDPVMIDSPSSWVGWSRVTPSPKGAVLDQTIIGTFFHACMEYLPEDLSRPSDDALVALALAQGECVAHPAMLELLLKQGKVLLDKFFESELFTLKRSAKNRYTEMPYAILLDDKWEIRRPDLVLEDSTGQWHIIDYKTDSFDLSQLENQIRLHRKQLDTYASELQKLTNIKFNSSLYFAQHGQLKSL